MPLKCSTGMIGALQGCETIGIQLRFREPGVIWLCRVPYSFTLRRQHYIPSENRRARKNRSIPSVTSLPTQGPNIKTAKNPVTWSRTIYNSLSKVQRPLASRTSFRPASQLGSTCLLHGLFPEQVQPLLRDWTGKTSRPASPSATQRHRSGC